MLTHAVQDLEGALGALGGMVDIVLDTRGGSISIEGLKKLWKSIRLGDTAGKGPKGGVYLVEEPLGRDMPAWEFGAR